MKKFYLLCTILVFHVSLFGQVQSVNLQNYQGCNGATLWPFVIWSGTPRPVTVHYERQGDGGTWFNVVSQAYDVQTSHIVVSPTDISQATTYRIRAVDMTTLQEYFSAGVVVNPATWNVNRGAPNVTLSAGWGTKCDNTENFIGVSINSTVGGRPPYRIEYKPSTQANFLVAGDANGYFPIMGITPGTFYQVRVVDFCGNVSAVQNIQMNFTVSAVLVQDATTCTNGKFNVNAIGGVGALEYGIGKVTNQLGSQIIPDFVYRSSNSFDSLAPGDYYVRVRDACGNLSQNGFIRLGGGYPRLTAQSTIPANDSCTRNINVSVIQGSGPFEYGIRYIQDPQSAWSWQSSNVFTNLNRSGVYFIRIKDMCGAVSDSAGVSVGTIPTPVVDSIIVSNLPGCNQEITVHASGGYKPFEYTMYPLSNPTNITTQTSNVFSNLPPAMYNISVKDRCQRITPNLNYILPTKNLTLHTSAGMDSCGAKTGFLAVDSISDGLPPYQYSISNMANTQEIWTPWSTDSIYRGLAPGLYAVRVRDACGVEKEVDNIAIASSLTFDYQLIPPGIDCSPFLLINVHGGAQTEPFSYFITNGVHKIMGMSADSIFSISNLPDGNYTITITNACGDTAGSSSPSLVVTGSGIPQISFEVQYFNNCTEANIVVHGAPAGSAYQIQTDQGFFESADSVFRSQDYAIATGKYYVAVYNTDFCNFIGFFYEDTVTVVLSGTSLTGAFDPDKSDSLCLYNLSPVPLDDFLVNEYPGGTWTSTAVQGFDALAGTFNASEAGAGDYEFTYSITDSCGALHQTSFVITVAPEACFIRMIAGDYQTSLQATGCPEINSAGFNRIDFSDNNGNLLFSLNPNGNFLGIVCAGVRILDGDGTALRTAVIDGKVTYFLDRNFYIESNSGGISPITVFLYFTNEEMDNMLNFLHNNGYPNATVNDIKILQKSGPDVDLQVTNEGSVPPQNLATITPNTYQNNKGWVMEFQVNSFSEFNPHFTGSSSNLPLRLLDFTAGNRQSHIRLQWTTADENNTSHFEIERSSNGNSFQSIARVNAAGHSTVERLYAYDDRQPAEGNNFYRLKMVDRDGRYTYSKTVAVHYEKITGMKLTPNPASDHLYISTSTNIKATAIRIFDAAGKLLYQEKANGNQPLKIYTGHLRHGWYLLELQTTSGNMRKAFLKQ